MASGTSSANKRNSFHKLSHILQLASPTFSRPSFDSQRRSTRNKFPKDNHAPPSPVSPASPPANERHGSCDPTTSVTSYFSSPHTPLLSHLQAADSGLPIPPTTNDLAAEEKMKLIRQARKISRVLGEVPVPNEAVVSCMSLDIPRRLSDVAEAPNAPRSPSMSPSSKIHNVSASAKKAFRRSLTFAQSGGSSSLQVHDMQRSKSFSTLRPSLNIPSPNSAAFSDVPSFSPILFASSQGVHVDQASPDGRPTVPSPSASINDTVQQHVPAGSSNRYSTSSSVSSMDITEQLQTPEQMQRQRMAKLTRQLGDSIPPDVLLRAASPPPSRSIPYPNWFYSTRDPSAVLSADNLPGPRRSRSLGVKSSTRRRPVSLEFPMFVASGVASAPVTPLGPPNTEVSEFSRLKGQKASASTQADESNLADDPARSNGPKSATPTVATGLDDLVSEKQRILNVKRARKMTQLFGDNPPTALFQITNFPASPDSYRNGRDSMATIISISSISLPGSTDQKLRDSFVSVMTSSSDVSPLIFHGNSDPQEDQEDEGSEDESPELSDDSSLLAPLSEFPPVPLLNPSHTIPRKRTVRPSTSPNPSRPTSPRHQAPRNLSIPSSVVIVPRTPPTPPPFSNFIDSPQPSRPSAVSIDVSSPEFHARRRRAAKLSKFFGVEVNTLVDILPNDVPAASMPRKASYAGPLPSPPLGGGIARASSVTVAEAKKGRRFLGVSEDGDVKELDMTEVIDQLRRMRS